MHRPISDARFIIALMKTETDALGFIPSTAIRDRWCPRGQYLIQRNHAGRRVGYLLHGIPRLGQPLHVNQVCIDIDDRRRQYATAVVRELLSRARHGGATSIVLRCAADLAANHFWSSMGFIPFAYEAGGRRRDRALIRYRLLLTDDTRG